MAEEQEKILTDKKKEIRQKVTNKVAAVNRPEEKRRVVVAIVEEFTDDEPKVEWQNIRRQLVDPLNPRPEIPRDLTNQANETSKRILQVFQVVKEVTENRLTPQQTPIPPSSLPLLTNLDKRIGPTLVPKTAILVAPFVDAFVTNAVTLARLQQEFDRINNDIGVDKYLKQDIADAIIKTAEAGQLSEQLPIDAVKERFRVKDPEEVVQEKRAVIEAENQAVGARRDAERQAVANKIQGALTKIDTFFDNWRPPADKERQMKEQVEAEVKQIHRGLDVSAEVFESEVDEKLQERINDQRGRIVALMRRMNQVYKDAPNEERAQRDFTAELTRLSNEGYLTQAQYNELTQNYQQMKEGRADFEKLITTPEQGTRNNQKDSRKLYEDVSTTRTQLEKIIMKDNIPADIKKKFLRLFHPYDRREDRVNEIAYLKSWLETTGNNRDASNLLNYLAGAEDKLAKFLVSPQMGNLYYRYDPNELNRIESEGLTGTLARQGVIDAKLFFTPKQVQVVNALDNTEDFMWLLKSYAKPTKAGDDYYKYEVDFMKFYKDVKSIFEEIIDSAGFFDSDQGNQMQLQYYKSLLKQFQNLALNIPSRDREFATSIVDIQDLSLYPDENQKTIGMVPRNQFAFPHKKQKQLGDALGVTLQERLGNLHNALNFSNGLQKAIDQGKGYTGIKDYINSLSTEDIDWLFFEDPEMVKAYNMYRETLSEVLSLTKRTIPVNFGKTEDTGLSKVESKTLTKLLAYVTQQGEYEQGKTPGETRRRDFDAQELARIRRRLKRKIRVASGLAKGYYGEDWRTFMGARLPVDYDKTGPRQIEERNPDGTFKRDDEGNIVYKKRKKRNLDGSIFRDEHGKEVDDFEVMINPDTGLVEQALKLNYRYKLTHSGGINATLGKLSPAAMWNFVNGPSFLPYVRRAAIPRPYDLEAYAPIEEPHDPRDPYGLTVEKRPFDSLVKDRYDHTEIYEYTKEWDEALIYGYSKNLMDYLYKKIPYEDFTLRNVMDNLDKGGWRTQQFMAYIVKEPKGKPTTVNQGYENQAQDQDYVINFRATMQNMMSLGSVAVREFIKSPDVYNIDEDTYKDITGKDKPKDLAGKNAHTHHEKQHAKDLQDRLRLQLVEKYIFGQDIRSRPTRVIAHERREYTPRGESLVIDKMHDYLYKVFQQKIKEGQMSGEFFSDEFLSTEVLGTFIDATQIAERKAQYERREMFTKTIAKPTEVREMVQMIYRGLSDTERAYVEDPTKIPEKYSKLRKDVIEKLRSLRQRAYTDNLSEEDITKDDIQKEINGIKGELLDYEFTTDELQGEHLENALRMFYRETQQATGAYNVQGKSRSFGFLTEDEFIAQHKGFVMHLRKVIDEDRYTNETQKMKTTLPQRFAFFYQHFGSFKYDIGGDNLDLSRMPSQQGGTNAVARDVGAGANWENLAIEFENIVTKAIPEMVIKSYPDDKAAGDASKVLNEPINKIADFLKSSDIQAGRHFTAQMLAYFSAMAGEDAVFRQSITGEILEIANRNWTKNKRQASLYTDFLPVYLSRPTTAFSMDQMMAIGHQVAHATKLPDEHGELVVGLKKQKFGPFTFNVPIKKDYEVGGQKIWTLEQFKEIDGQTTPHIVWNRLIPIAAVALCVIFAVLMAAAWKKKNGK